MGVPGIIGFLEDEMEDAVGCNFEEKIFFAQQADTIVARSEGYVLRVHCSCLLRHLEEWKHLEST
jgi:hypothetical protein